MSELGAIYMSTPKNIIDEALSLSVNDKAELVDQLLSAIDCLDEDIEKQWASEAESRIDAYETGKLKSISLEEVLSKYK
jgi:putative addiction module component (TIGR02574 family)